MPSKKKLRKQIRWYEKAFDRYESIMPRLEFECEKACGENDRLRSDLAQLQAAAGHLVDALDAHPGLRADVHEHRTVVRALLRMGQAPKLAEAVEKPRAFSWPQVKAMKFGEPGTVLHNTGRTGGGATTFGTFLEGPAGKDDAA
ncbi:hypothetical protein [Nocardia xishanensis]|uniref:hypothetical protein n=1 Tax=Nocardia xishanensis TaxID=238964 RepID=UPI00082C1CF6|nr:hypothetical protein [Nocardia xishanensis]